MQMLAQVHVSNRCNRCDRRLTHELFVNELFVHTRTRTHTYAQGCENVFILIPLAAGLKVGVPARIKRDLLVVSKETY